MSKSPTLIAWVAVVAMVAACLAFVFGLRSIGGLMLIGALVALSVGWQWALKNRRSR